MSSSRFHKCYFIHVHIVVEEQVYCTWYAHSVEDGAWLDQCVLAAEVVETDNLDTVCQWLAKKFPNTVGFVFVPCTNDHLTPAQKRLIHVD